MKENLIADFDQYRIYIRRNDRIFLENFLYLDVKGIL